MLPPHHTPFRNAFPSPSDDRRERKKREPAAAAHTDNYFQLNHWGITQAREGEGEGGRKMRKQGPRPTLRHMHTEGAEPASHQQAGTRRVRDMEGPGNAGRALVQRQGPAAPALDAGGPELPPRSLPGIPPAGFLCAHRFHDQGGDLCSGVRKESGPHSVPENSGRTQLLLPIVWPSGPVVKT